VVDEDDLACAVDMGGISHALAETARSIAYHLADLLRAGGDWREADSMAPSPRGRGLIQG